MCTGAEIERERHRVVRAGAQRRLVELECARDVAGGKAETVSYDDLGRTGSVAAAREKGVYRIEGKEYVVQDGDVLHFKFSV